MLLSHLLLLLRRIHGRRRHVAAPVLPRPPRAFPPPKPYIQCTQRSTAEAILGVSKAAGTKAGDGSYAFVSRFKHHSSRLCPRTLPHSCPIPFIPVGLRDREGCAFTQVGGREKRRHSGIPSRGSGAHSRQTHFHPPAPLRHIPAKAPPRARKRSAAYAADAPSQTQGNGPRHRQRDTGVNAAFRHGNNTAGWRGKAAEIRKNRSSERSDDLFSFVSAPTYFPGPLPAKYLRRK